MENQDLGMSEEHLVSQASVCDEAWDPTFRVTVETELTKSTSRPDYLLSVAASLS